MVPGNAGHDRDLAIQRRGPGAALLVRAGLIRLLPWLLVAVACRSRFPVRRCLSRAAVGRCLPRAGCRRIGLVVRGLVSIPGAGDADESADDKPDTAAASAGEAAPDRSAGEATPDRKPAPAGDRDQKPGEKPDKPGADEKGGSGATPLDGEVTIVPGVSRYHRRGCILIRFLSDGDLETMTRGEAETAGSIPCKACQPDKPLSQP